MNQSYIHPLILDFFTLKSFSLIPFMITARILLILHLFYLYINDSNNPFGFNRKYLKISLHPYFTTKDIGFLVINCSLYYLKPSNEINIKTVILK